MDTKTKYNAYFCLPWRIFAADVKLCPGFNLAGLGCCPPPVAAILTLFPTRIFSARLSIEKCLEMVDLAPASSVLLRWMRKDESCCCSCFAP